MARTAPRVGAEVLRIRTSLALAVAALGPCSRPRASARPAGFKRLLAGQIAGGGTFDVSGRRGRLQGVKGVLPRPRREVRRRLKARRRHRLRVRLPVGGRQRDAGRHLEQLRRRDVLEPRRRHRHQPGADREDPLRRRNTPVKLRTHRPPRGWRELLHMRVRVYGASVLARTHAQTRYTTGYDRHGHKVAGHR